MAKTKAETASEKTSRRAAFRERSEKEIAEMNEADREKYYKKLKEKKAKEAAGKKETVNNRLELLESVLQTPVVKKGDLTCDLIDATFISPCKRTMYVTEERLVKYFDEGDMIQLNCHTIPRAKIPCVIVRNGEFYFAQKKNDTDHEYANLDSQSSAENESFEVTDEEYVGDIVNVIRNPKRLLEAKE